MNIMLKIEDIYNKRVLLTENSINSANSSLIKLKDRIIQSFKFF